MPAKAKEEKTEKLRRRQNREQKAPRFAGESENDDDGEMIVMKISCQLNRHLPEELKMTGSWPPKMLTEKQGIGGKRRTEGLMDRNTPLAPGKFWPSLKAGPEGRVFLM